MPDTPSPQEETDRLCVALHKRLTQLFFDVSTESDGSYKPNYMRKQVGDLGGYDAACNLVMCTGGTSGFHKLIGLQLPKLTVEYIILTGPWRDIMPDEVVERARNRLQEVGVVVP
ncbi:hypothetical protein [Prosthecobacter dejongeii]|uniref:Uncharacterized protein n=1 Tax=Prosthecobacter dejongeii TaxID=48465 RepID=A0A7W8DPC2_9BACT|nr:hypothetical protein [Prosthecobacter dejongeii]MBB5036771.1 hypothetical protein [Prosthecobacter dejongeii]